MYLYRAFLTLLDALLFLLELLFQNPIRAPDSISINITSLQPSLDFIFSLCNATSIILVLEAFTTMQHPPIIENDTLALVQLPFVHVLWIERSFGKYFQGPVEVSPGFGVGGLVGGNVAVLRGWV